MGFPGCLQEGLRRMPYPWEHSPWRRELQMLLKSWVFPNVRYSPLTQGPTSVVTLHSDSLSSLQIFLCLLGSSQSICDLPGPVWLCPGANTRARSVHCMGRKYKLCFYTLIYWLQNYVGFEWKPNPKGFKKPSVEYACMGRVSSDTPVLEESCTMVGYISIFSGHQARVYLSCCAWRTLCKTMWKEARYLLLTEWHQLR